MNSLYDEVNNKKEAYMAQAIVSIFKEESEVESAISELKDLGYDPKEFSVAMKDFRKVEGDDASPADDIVGGAVTGAAAGGILAGVAGLLVSTGILTLPGLGALFVAGPIATALGLTGAAATTTTAALAGAAGGGIIGALAGWGMSEKDASYYEEKIKEGGIMLMVPTHDQRTQEVRKILEDNGATDVRQLEMHD